MYEYTARIESVVDGDTVDAIIDLGFKTSNIAEITLPDDRNLSDALIEAGLAKPYDGGKKQ